MSILRRFFRLACIEVRRCGERIDRLRHSFLCRFTPIIKVPIEKDASLYFYCPTQTSRRRAKTLLTKEPGTIQWIETFGKDSVFWDVGSNIGTFSLYATAVRSAKVLEEWTLVFKLHESDEECGTQQPELSDSMLLCCLAR